MLAEAAEGMRTEYAARMNRVLDHIQNHLDEPLSLEHLAGVACFSPFHFHRLFRAWMGETLQEFVHRLRLERAAQLLVFDRIKSISDIALDCGFSGPGAFARAFKTAYGVPASEWRKRKFCEVNRKNWEAECGVNPGFLRKSPMRNNPPFEVQVRRLAPMTIAYIRHVGPYQGDTALFRRLFEQLFAWATPRGLMGPDLKYLSLYQDNPNLTPAAKQRLEVAILVPPGTAPEGKVGVRKTESGLCATVKVRVRLEDYAAQWDRLLADWLPDSGYQPDHRAAMEFYLNNPDTDPEGCYEIEICLPVRGL